MGKNIYKKIANLVNIKYLKYISPEEIKIKGSNYLDLLKTRRTEALFLKKDNTKNTNIIIDSENLNFSDLEQQKTTCIKNEQELYITSPKTLRQALLILAQKTLLRKAIWNLKEKFPKYSAHKPFQGQKNLIQIFTILLICLFCFKKGYILPTLHFLTSFFFLAIH